MKRPKKPPAPAKLRITAEPTSIVADGATKSVITMQLLDKKGKPIAAIADTQVQVSAAKGKLQPAVVTIPKGKDTEKAFLISSTETGPAPVSAAAEGLKSITITLNFLEKSRYCMHCGTLMPPKAKACKNCGKLPPAGVDTKLCQNCDAVIPVVAKFCSECGAGQKE
jgi:ribosomal protein L40E